MVKDDAMIPKEKELLPGVTLTVCPTKRFKVGTFSLSFLLPLNREELAVRSLLLSVLRRGTKNYPTMERINRRLDDLYATPYHVNNTSRGNWQCIGYGADLLGEAYLLEQTDLFGGVLSLMEQIIFEPLLQKNGQFMEHYVEAERSNSIQVLRALKNQPSTYAMVQFGEIFYRNSLRGHMLSGTEDQVRAVTSEQLTSLWHSMLQTAPIRCFYIGEMPEEILTERLQKTLVPALERVGRSPMLQSKSTLELPFGTVADKPVVVERELNVGQSHLILGFRTPVTIHSPLYYAMMMYQEILGVSPVSRLFVHVREKYGLCYSCSSEYHMDRGELIISCDISAQNRELAECAILEQIEVMKAGAFTDAEWDAAQKSLQSSYCQLNDSTHSMAEFYEMRAVLGIHQSLEECRRQLAAVTKEQVIAVANSLRLDVIFFQKGTADEMDEWEEEDVENEF